MKRRTTFFILTVFFLLFSGKMFFHDGRSGGEMCMAEGKKESSEKPGERKADSTKNFIELHDIYLRWKDGDFGSRKFYRNRLYFHLLALMGHRIETGFDYYLDTPELIYEQRLRFVLYHGNWLNIQGKFDKGSIREAIGGDTDLLYRWWRSGRLLSVSGVLKGYRIADWERKIYVQLDDIRVKALDQKKGREEK